MAVTAAVDDWAVVGVGSHETLLEIVSTLLDLTLKPIQEKSTVFKRLALGLLRRLTRHTL